MLRITRPTYSPTYSPAPTSIPVPSETLRIRELLGNLIAHRAKNPFEPRFEAILPLKKGRITIPGIAEYDGSHLGDVYHGVGKLTILEPGKKGDFYQGRWVEGKFTGSGVVRVTEGDGEVYQGEWKDYNPHGRGSLWNPRTKEYYEGQWDQGYKTGVGKGFEIFDDGAFYEGKLRDGGLQGMGIYARPNGDYIFGKFEKGRPQFIHRIRHTDISGIIYEGELLNGAIDGVYHGKGRFTEANGDYYDGEWIHGEQNGNGRARRTIEAGTYEGEIKEGKFHGYGEFRMESGAGYVGEWLDGLEHGFGKRTEATGEWCEGVFDKGEWTGSGKQLILYKSGATYEGEVKEGVKWGYGQYTCANGEYSDGEFVDGKFHGEGNVRRFFEDGVIYEGEFKNEKPHGRGTVTSPDFTMYDGEWADGKRLRTGYIRRKIEKDGWYEGEVVDDVAHGVGRFMTLSQSQYIGECVNGQCEGQGFSFTDSNAWYHGRFKDGRMQNVGINRCELKAGGFFEGFAMNGMPRGVGLYEHTDGSVRIIEFNSKGSAPARCTLLAGEIKLYRTSEPDFRERVAVVIYPEGNRFVGWVDEEGNPDYGGCFTYSNGDYLNGTWEKGEIAGSGMMKTTYTDGTFYEGHFKTDRSFEPIRDGLGTLTGSDGKTISYGMWHNDRLVFEIKRS